MRSLVKFLLMFLIQVSIRFQPHVEYTECILKWLIKVQQVGLTPGKVYGRFVFKITNRGGAASFYDFLKYVCKL